MFRDKKFIGSCIAALCLAARAFCQHYVAIVSSPGENTSPAGINRAGSVTGTFEPFGSDYRYGFVRDAGGAITTFNACDVSFFLATFSSGINDAGAVTGSCIYNLSFLDRGFVRDPQGNVTRFDPSGSIDTEPKSINARGVITGYYYIGETNLSHPHGFVRHDNGTVISFDPPGSIQTLALSINSRGDITGYYNEANLVVHGFVRRADGTFVLFDAPGSTGTYPVGINDAGAITGYYRGPNGATYGFVRASHGVFTSFAAAGYTFPASINDEGAITGFYSTAASPGPTEGITRGFVRSPKGTITSFDPNETEPTVCSSSPRPPRVFPTSINQAGVITGYCFLPIGSSGSGYFAQGWVRYP